MEDNKKSRKPRTRVYFFVKRLVINYARNKRAISFKLTKRGVEEVSAQAGFCRNYHETQKEIEVIEKEHPFRF